MPARYCEENYVAADSASHLRGRQKKNPRNINPGATHSGLCLIAHKPELAPDGFKPMTVFPR